jgi:GT2 family glycosyltransferase
MIAIVVLTHNRQELLRRCVEKVLLRTSELTREIVIWDNASSDGTPAYLDALTDARVRVVHHPDNIAMNALPRAIRLTTAPYIVELDDDVVEAPERWDESLLDAYQRLPEIGFLCASIAYDPDDPASRYLRYMREELGAYTPREVNGVRILAGSVGGACTMTSRELYERVGGFREHRKHAYWRPDIPYQRAIRKLGYDSAFLADVEVRHQGVSGSRAPRPKLDYHDHEWKLRMRKDRAKRVILAIPPIAALNRRYRWFDPPVPPFDPAKYDHEPPAGSSRHPTQAS